LQFYFSFWRSKLVSCEKVAAEVVKSHFHLSFGDPTSFRAEGLRFVPSRCTAPRPQIEIEKTKEKRRGQESKRAREQEGKRECEDVKMRRCEDMKM